ncbi:MAG: tRNA (adenosine(37)-N6)-threonylcarbamoyltransferase complex dimerization subunit type 1 TsaB [Ruminococcus sp.]|nr:tRNA (adenosine(37)-N6)-threonylcarbamoyltransferase complex dimerization subunit type 1 TsaB [Ruminococcus sp.]
MYTLYIDTHFTNLEMILLKDGNIYAKEELNSDKHSSYTVNMLKKILEDSNLTVEDLNEIIVINGPGSFTGVRIGVVIAKLLSYTKKIKLKAISYLEALSLNYNEDITLGIKDKNGVFVGIFNKEHELQSDYFYLTNKELENYPNNITIGDKIDIIKVYNFLEGKECMNPHLLKPLYIKKIEAQK